jgi:hypothetical protein
VSLPFDEDAIPPYEEFMQLPFVHVPMDWLVPTQSKLVIGRLLDMLGGGPTEGPDPLPHVVDFQGRGHVYNGGGRWAIAKIQGWAEMTVRVVKL